MNRRRAMLGGLAALIASPIQAKDRWRVLEPPEWAKVEPIEPYTVRYVSQAKVNAACAFETKVAWLKRYRAGEGNPPVDAYGCTDVNTRTVLIVRSIEKDPELLEQVLWHEKAHLNGWRH